MKVLSIISIMVFLIVSPASAHAGETIRIASIFGATGPSASGNKATIEGIRFAVQEVNQSGGLLGKQIELLEFDNRSSVLYSKLTAQKAIKSGVIAVFGANWSSNSLAMAPVFQAAGIPMISPFSTNPDVTLVGDYIFRVCFIDSFQGPVMAKFAFQDLKAGTAAILTNADSRYSEGLALFFKRAFEQLGGKILFNASYLQDGADFSSYLNKIKRVHPDIVFVPGQNTDSGRIIKQARETGLTLPFLGGDGWSDLMYDIAGSAIQGSFYSGHWHKDNKNTKSRQFVEKYMKKYKKMENIGPAMANDVVFLFSDAVRRAGSLEPSKIRDALAATKNFKGVTGDITFNENGDPIKSAIILKFDKGTSVYVKTIAP